MGGREPIAVLESCAKGLALRRGVISKTVDGSGVSSSSAQPLEPSRSVNRLPTWLLTAFAQALPRYFVGNTATRDATPSNLVRTEEHSTLPDTRKRIQ
jgi:hypothetical protein